MAKYIVRTIKDERFGVLEVSAYNSDMLVYKMPYSVLKQRNITIDNLNNFICYILYGYNPQGNDFIYVGKSKNGLKDRPISHENKYKNWNYCYILTNIRERTFFNDGTIQYIEDKIKHRIDDLGIYTNVTEQTTSGTINKNDEEICDDYLNKVYGMLYSIGLDLKEKYVEGKAKNSDLEIIDNIEGNVFNINYKYCSLSSFSFLGETYHKDSFRDMLGKIIEILYAKNKDDIEKLAKSKYRIKGAKRIYMSFDKKDFKNECTELYNSGIYYLVNLSQSNIMSFIKNLLLTLGYKLEDFRIDVY